MPFKDTLTEVEFTSLQESDRPLYIKKDGEAGQAATYNLHPSFVAERTALTTKNQQIANEKKTAAEQLKAFQDLGLDPTKIKELSDAQAAAEAAKLTDKQREEQAITSLKTAHQTELQKLTTSTKQREEFLMKELRRNMIDAVARIAIKEAGGQVEPLLPHIVAAMDIVEDGEDGAKQFVTRVMGDDRAARYVGSDFMTPTQLVEEFKKKEAFGGLFSATGAGGGGAQSKQRGTPLGTDVNSMSSVQMIEKGLADRSRR